LAGQLNETLPRERPPRARLNETPQRDRAHRPDPVRRAAGCHLSESAPPQVSDVLPAKSGETGQMMSHEAFQAAERCATPGDGGDDSCSEAF
jgi:hypothetical protein